ncbi:sugar phosphate isomerase/epimerase family protein [Pelagibacterium lentulum]|uniref:Xylose isomerase n=1 Tax=Pelagibacterium lentulum TaxID=2029865 RepID=A0A916RB83_9HYPH|nr:sugar phosphate isomerase/epimerase [Pelagibacterium lentulum]GGA49717.1 xylose isomerase [Pelagibacterium lentulum]
MFPLALAHLTALDLPPPALVQAAAKAGFAKVGLRLHPAAPGAIEYYSVPGTPDFAELKAVLDGEGIRIHDIEIVSIGPGFAATDYLYLLEAGQALGAATLNVSGDDEDRSRLTDNFAALCEQARTFAMRVDLEFMRWRAIGTLEQSAEIVTDANAGNGRILLDALHLFRSGGSIETLKSIDRSLIGSIQLCDGRGPIPSGDEAVIFEARQNRFAPGDGELPLKELVEHLADLQGLQWGVETPMLDTPAPDCIARGHAGASVLLGRF